MPTSSPRFSAAPRSVLLVAFAALSAGCGGADDSLFGASPATGATGVGGGASTSVTGSGGGATSTSTSTSTGQGGASTSTTGQGGATTTSTTGQGGAGGASTTTTTTTTTSTTSTTTTTTTTTTTNGPEASCGDGQDDDGDGLADCADPGCVAAGATCLALPAGTLAAFVRSAGACPAGTTPKSVASCAGAACACTGSTAACSFQVTRWNFDDCASGQPSGLKTSDGCYYVSPGTNSAFLGNSKPNGATTCAPASPMVASAPRALCELVSREGCGGGACAAPAVDLAPACVLLPVGAACPPSWDASAEIVSADPAAACACACAKTGEPCSSTVTAFADQSCKTATGASAPIDGACHPVGPLGSYYLTAGSATATCAPSGALAAPSGVLCCRTPAP